jgi:UV excision repair protein RAD23
LFKGKALADGKLLKEYSLSDGDTVNLMIKPGVSWDPSAVRTTQSQSETSHAPSSLSPTPPPTADMSSAKLNPDPKVSSTARKHQRIPSVVLSPSSSTDSPGLVDKPGDITLNLDGTPSPTGDALSTYHEVLANPDFWLRLRTFLGSALFIHVTDFFV